MKKLLVLFFILFLVCCNGGGGGSSKKKDKPKDPCAGPVPCLNTDWGEKYAVFYDDGVPYVLSSNGNIFAFVGIFMNGNKEVAIIGFSGPVTKCRVGEFNYGLIDYNLDNVFDDELFNVVGWLSICDEILEVGDVEFDLNNIHWWVYDIVAYYDGMATLSKENVLETEMPVGVSALDDIKIRINLVKEILNQ